LTIPAAPTIVRFMALEILREELAFFNEKKDELLRTDPGQFALIKGRTLIGVFATREEAYTEGVQRFCGESFLVPLLAYSLRANF